MKIGESKNLKHDKIANISTGGDDYDNLEFQPRVCVLDSFERTDDILLLYFKNRTRAAIKAHNTEGSGEIDAIEKKLPNFIKHSYEEILNTEI